MYVVGKMGRRKSEKRWKDVMANHMKKMGVNDEDAGYSLVEV